MKLPDLTELALRNLRESLLRNSLTTVGISVGVASLVAMLSLGIGLQQLFSRRLEKSGLFDTVLVTSRRDLRGMGREEERNGPPPGESRMLDESARLEMERDSTVEMLDRCEHGALLVDAQARVLFANRAAEAMLRDDRGLRLRGRCLAAAHPAKTAALHAMIAGNDALSADWVLALPLPDGAKVVLQVLPLRAETAWLAERPSAIVFIKRPDAASLPSRAQIQLLFDLTPAQAALAGEILRGDGIQAAADRLRISRATARSHLLEVFQKTGTSRQAELVRVILQHAISRPRATI